MLLWVLDRPPVTRRGEGVPTRVTVVTGLGCGEVYRRCRKDEGVVSPPVELTGSTGECWADVTAYYVPL